ncbi:MAG: hypothetical protein IT308_07595 [Anaerolineaceae bacterium]|nr:hypothetical protein [Anaerolineaceae bacterium]
MKNFFSKFDWADLAAAAGFGMLFYGIYQVNPAAAFIVCGTILLFFGVVAAYGRADKR